MSLPSAQDIYQMLDVTWPAKSMAKVDDWTIREGAGGGKRVSAATLEADGVMDVALAEHAMQDLGQVPLFMIQDGQEDLDRLLGQLGYQVVDPVVLYSVELTSLTQTELPNARTYAVWQPLQVMLEIWEKGGIGPARVAVMDRVQTAKTAVMTRTGDTAGAVGFVAMDGPHAMIHAIETDPDQRRQGLGKLVLLTAAHWAAQHGGQSLNLAVTHANVAGNALYQSLGMTPIGRYHYRIKDTG